MRPIISMNFDCGGGLNRPTQFAQALAEMFRKCRDHGVTRVMYRTSACGHVYYPSKVMTPVYGHTFVDTCWQFRQWMACGDPFETFCDQARRAGLECWAWITSFDSYYVGLEDSFLTTQRPDLLMRSKPGLGPAQGLRGIPCYGEPETVAYRLQEAREVAGYDIDGIFYSLRSHSGHVRRKKDLEGQWTFGFNEPVVQRYGQLHGVDICSEPFDGDALRQLHGQFYAEFLRKVRDELRPRGRRLNAMVDPKGWRGYIWGDQVMIGTPWDQWLEDDVVDEVTLESGHELICDNLVDAPDLTFAHPQRTMLWVYEGHKVNISGDEIAPGLALCDKLGLSGITIHEAGHFLDDGLSLWDLLGQSVQRYCSR